GAETLPRYPSSAPEPNLTCRFQLTFEPARQINALDAVNGLWAVSRVGAGEARWRIIPQQEFSIHLSELDPGIHPPEPEFIVLGKIARFVAAVLLQPHPPEHNAGMRHRRLHKTTKSNVFRREQRIAPGDMRGISRLRGWIASMPHAAGDHAELRLALETLQLPQQPLRRAPVVGVQPRDKFAA